MCIPRQITPIQRIFPIEDVDAADIDEVENGSPPTNFIFNVSREDIEFYFYDSDEMDEDNDDDEEGADDIPDEVERVDLPVGNEEEDLDLPAVFRAADVVSMYSDDNWSEDESESVQD